MNQKYRAFNNIFFYFIKKSSCGGKKISTFATPKNGDGIIVFHSYITVIKEIIK